MLQRFVAIDLETTGLNAGKDKIIEIGAVRFENGEISETYETYVNPGISLLPEISDLTGIVDQDLAQAPKFEDLVVGLEAFLQEDILLGHRILFDYSFLKRGFSFYHRPFEKKGIDTLKLARTNLPDLKSKRLGDLCAYYQIPIKAHRALEDAKATGTLYMKMAQQFEAVSQATPIPLICHVKKETPATKSQKEQIQRLINQYGMELTYEVEMLTRSEASRKIEEILQKARHLV